MSSIPVRCDWATHAAARYAVRHWHYSRSMPCGRSIKVGVWEGEKFIGAVIFARGASAQLGKPYGLQQTEVCELCRIALTTHVTPVSRIVRFAVRLLLQQSPGLRLIVSFADPERGHHGGIYQAGNWIYTGPVKSSVLYRVNGKIVHRRAMEPPFGANKDAASAARFARQRAAAERVTSADKHRYLMPLDDAMRARVQSMAQPYPKRPKHAMAGTPPAQRRGSTDPAAPLIPT